MNRRSKFAPSRLVAVSLSGIVALWFVAPRHVSAGELADRPDATVRADVAVEPNDFKIVSISAELDSRRVTKHRDTILRDRDLVERGSTVAADPGGVAGLLVSNVTASQRSDGSHVVDIFYDLAGAPGENKTISVQASDNDGLTWTVPVRAGSLSGDVGAGTEPGAGKHIEWDCAADLPAASGTLYRVRVCAASLGGDMVLIPAGEFVMGDHHDGSIYELPLHAVYTDAYYMDKFEVTNQQYADALNWAWAQGELTIDSEGYVHGSNSPNDDPYCLIATTNPGISRIIWNGSAFGVVGQELPAGDPGNKTDHPMVTVSWYGSAVYANWRSEMEGRTPSYDTATWECDFDADGYRLPTNAEWEKAARGGNHNPYYRFPWGDTIDGSNANYRPSGDPYEAGDIPWTTPVGYYDGGQIPPGVDMANGYGLYDMAGNAAEWVHDRFSYPAPCDPSPCINPRGPVSTPFSTRVMRSGVWAYGHPYLRCAFRGSVHPSYVNFARGLRLALSSAAGPEADGCGDSATFAIDNLVFGDIDRTGSVDLNDILCVLSAFGGDYTCTDGLVNADIIPCGGNGIVNLDDILGVFAGFAGADPCP